MSDREVPGLSTGAECVNVVTAGVVLRIPAAMRAYVQPHAAGPAEATHAQYRN